MNRHKILVFSLIIVVAMSITVSAFWPFSSEITGKVVDNQAIDDSDFNNCQDSDGGIYSEIAGTVTYKGWRGSAKTVDDTCVGNRLMEYYCDENKGAKKSTRFSCEFGCDAGACIIPVPSCEAISQGAKNEKGEIFRNKCDGSDYTEYSCNFDGTIVEGTTTNCPGECSVTKGGCVAVCVSETDEADDKDVPGKVTIEGGIEFKDTCLNTKRVKQYTCSDAGVLVNLNPEGCGASKECIENSTGEGYCRDIIAGTGTIELLQQQIVTLQDLIDALTTRIEVLENPVA